MLMYVVFMYMTFCVDCNGVLRCWIRVGYHENIGQNCKYASVV